VADHFKVDQFIGLGAGAGGRIMMQFAMGFPSRVRCFPLSINQSPQQPIMQFAMSFPLRTIPGFWRSDCTGGCY
jgi:hypothetical protein